MNKKTTCRICLRFGTKLGKTSKSLFEIHNGSSISDNIVLIANVKIQPDDGLPSKICAECLTELDAAISFKDKCERSNKLLLTDNKNEQVADTLSNTQLLIPIELVKKEDSFIEDEEDIVYEEIEYYYDDNVDDCTKTEKQEELTKVYFDDDTITKVEEDLSKDTSPVKTEQKLEDDSATATIQQKTTLKKSKAIDLKLECHDCGGSFKSKCKLRVHWKTVHMLEKLICKFCKRSFKNFTPYNNHMKKRPRDCLLASKTLIDGVGRSRVFYCKHCSYKSNQPRAFNNHLNVHTGDRPYFCNICSKGFSQLGTLQAHNEDKHNAVTKEITCQYCGELVRGRRKIYKHLQKHTNKPVQCDVCKKMYKTKNTLIEHMKHHSGVKAFTCEICAASFYSYRTLLNHTKHVHNADKTKYKCDTCGCNFSSLTAMKRHIPKHTSFNIACNVCGRFYLSAEELASHQKLHTKEKSICIQCNRIFCDEKSLKRHKRTTHKHKQNLLKEKSKFDKNPVVELKDEKVEVQILPLLK